MDKQGMIVDDRLRTRAATPRERGEIATDRNFVTALGRGLSVLESFSQGAAWQSSTDVEHAVQLPKATVSRLLQGLTSMGYLYYSPHRRQYRLGTAVLALGFVAKDTNHVRDMAQPYLEKLADEYGVHAALCSRDHLDVIHLEVCHSSRTLMTLNLDMGSRIPLAGTATGHALLAVVPEPELSHLMAQLRERHARYWLEISAKIQEGTRQFRSRGYTWSVAGWRTDINGVAVPISGLEGPSMALSCGAPARHLPRRTMDEIGRRLITIKESISRQLLGYGARDA